MSTPTFTWALTEAEVALVREALGMASAVKGAQGDADVAAEMNLLRERAEGLPIIQIGEALPTSYPSGSRTGDVNNSFTGTAAGVVVQMGDYDGDLKI